MEQEAINISERFQRCELHLELSRHGVEGACEIAEFIVPRHASESFKVAMRDAFRRLHQQVKWSHLSANGDHGQPRDQQDSDENESTQIQVCVITAR